MPGTIAVQHAAGEHIGDGLEAAVRMIRKARDVVVRLIAAKGVEHEKGVQAFLQGTLEQPGQFYPRPIGGHSAGYDALHPALLLVHLCTHSGLSLRSLCAL